MHETNLNFTTRTKGKNTQARECCVQFLVIVLFFLGLSFVLRGVTECNLNS